MLDYMQSSLVLSPPRFHAWVGIDGNRQLKSYLASGEEHGTSPEAHWILVLKALT